MNCIITAGPTYEPLDEVRRLTNFSTGTLGCELAAFLSDHGWKVTLLKSETATYCGPLHASQILPFSTTQDLKTTLESLASKDFQAVFHAAAVNDFSVAQTWAETKDGQRIPLSSRKISTDYPKVFLELAPTPKILPLLHEWFPAAALVGWKYEMEGTREEVVAKGNRQIATSRSLACVLNGAAYGSGFGLLKAAGDLTHCPDKTALFHHLLTLKPAA